QVANLSSWANKSIKVSFLFISDQTGNYNINPETEPWQGVYLDSIRVQAMGASSYCDAETPDCADDQDGCTSQECSLFSQGGGGVCAQQTTTPGKDCKGCTGPGKESECGTDPCFDYACVEGICNADLKLECCAPSSTFPELTAPPEVSYEGFESGLGQEWLITDPYDDNVSWQVSPILPYEGTGVLYFGDPLTQTYQACPNAPCLQGNPVNPAKATVWSPYFEVGDDLFRKPVAAFWLWMSTEYDVVKSNPAVSVDCEELTDRLTIWVEDSDGSDPVDAWNSCDAVENSTQNVAGGWIHEGVDLTAYAGSTIRLGFEFDSHDPPDTAVSNDYGGVRIDQLTVSSVCGADACVASSDCDDANLCTADLCTLGVCTNTQDNPLCCLEDNDCDDG
ncbi:MAG: hypothetical protein VX938_11460, partial [Myxococcota bacterium]|nr:hypothetical protein [Myxococcota bacterium]